MANKDEIKVFQIDDYTWYAGRSWAECLGQMSTDTGMLPEEITESNVPAIDRAAVPESEMDRLKFVEDETDPETNGPIEKTFREKLNEMIDAGESFPTFFASTEY